MNILLLLHCWKYWRKNLALNCDITWYLFSCHVITFFILTVLRRQHYIGTRFLCNGTLCILQKRLQQGHRQMTSLQRKNYIYSSPIHVIQSHVLSDDRCWILCYENQITYTCEKHERLYTTGFVSLRSVWYVHQMEGLCFLTLK